MYNSFRGLNIFLWLALNIAQLWWTSFDAPQQQDFHLNLFHYSLWQQYVVLYYEIMFIKWHNIYCKHLFICRTKDSGRGQRCPSTGTPQSWVQAWELKCWNSFNHSAKILWNIAHSAENVSIKIVLISFITSSFKHIK